MYNLATSAMERKVLAEGDSFENGSHFIVRGHWNGYLTGVSFMITCERLGWVGCGTA